MIRNRLISLLLIFVLSASLCTFVYGNDYEGHWGYNEIAYLMSKGAVSGDSAGVRPDDPIKRAEWIKVINQIFGFKIPASEGFADISPDMWYYNDMLIAKQAGIILGDENNCCNPEDDLTRAEASVILARLLGLAPMDSGLDFSDALSVPHWAAGYVGALKFHKILSGYLDGSFRPQQPMSRAESFVLIARTEKWQNQGDEAPQTNQPSVSIPVIAGGSGSGGGSGGGGGGGNSIGLATPSITSIDLKEMKIYWLSGGSATSSYNLEIKIKTSGKSGEKTITTGSTSANIGGEVESLIGADRKPLEVFAARVMAVGNGGSSQWSATMEFAVTNNTVRMPQIKVASICEGNTETIKLVWTDDDNRVARYELYMDFGSGYELLANDLVYEAIIPNEHINDTITSYPAKFKVYSKNTAEVLDSEQFEGEIQMPLFGGADGDYSLIYNRRHFNNIEKNPTGMYKVKTDLKLPGHIPFVFSGTLIGDSDEAGGRAAMDITVSTASDAGLFSQITGAVHIENISIKGMVKTTGGNAGGLAGKATALADGAKILNIINEASVDGSNYGGGIIGDAYSDGATPKKMKMSNLVNYGTVIGRGGSAAGGGICGGLIGLIEDSKNFGAISAASYAAGGIVGNSYGSVMRCYNAGDITGNRGVGGIMGMSAGMAQDVFNSFNTGKVTAARVDPTTGQSGVGGIVGGHSQAADRYLTIVNCYNVGTVIMSESGSRANPVLMYKKEVNNAFVYNCFYLSEAGEDDGYDNTYPLTAEQMKNLDNFTSVSDGLVRSFKDAVWKLDSNLGYGYPQLISQPYTIYLGKPTIKKVVFNGTTVVVTVEGDAATVSYTLEVLKNGGNGKKLTAPIGGDQSVDIDITETIALDEYGVNYTIKIRANGDGILSSDRDGDDYTYKHLEFAGLLNGSGTDLDPYIVSSEADFGLIGTATYPISEVYSITSDLDFTGEHSEHFKSLGASGVGTGFSGKLIGALGGDTAQKPTIKFSVLSNETDQGLVRYLEGGTISNFVLEGTIKHTGTTGASINLGGVAGVVKGAAKIEKVDNFVQITTAVTSAGASAGIGGIAGNIAADAVATIKDCKNFADITPNGANDISAVGGIVGYASNTSSIITGCENQGTITARSYVGGIVGFGGNHASGITKGLTISLCANLGDITGNATSSATIGGIIGVARAAIDQCFNTGTITGNTNLGGIGGTCTTTGTPNISITNCYNTGTIKGNGTTRAGSEIVHGMNATGAGTYNLSLNYSAGVANNLLTYNRISTIAGSYNYYLEIIPDDPEVGALNAGEMQAQGSFTGFDFDDIWKFDGTSGYLYPQLQNNPHRTKSQ